MYEESFRKAIMTFQHQRVYDLMTEDLVHLSELSDLGSQDLDFLGPYPYIFIYDATLMLVTINLLYYGQRFFYDPFLNQENADTYRSSSRNSKR